MLGDNILSFSTDICNMKYVGINQKFLVKYFRAKFQAAASDKSYSCHTTDREIQRKKERDMLGIKRYICRKKSRRERKTESEVKRVSQGKIDYQRKTEGKQNKKSEGETETLKERERQKRQILSKDQKFDMIYLSGQR